MKFSECFKTIQGEGVFVGVPSVFFRTSFCNLRCHWCDTPWTSWKPENKDITVEEAADLISAFDCKHVVITGGEPYVQARDLTLLCDILVKREHFITVETNATIYVPTKAQFISMSPKLSNSTPSEELDKKWSKKHEKFRINAEAIQKFITKHGCQIKFVVAHEDDIIEIREIEEKLKLPKELIMLMPEGQTKREVRQKSEWLANLCKDNNYRYSPRLHVDIWGKKRGV